MNREWLEKDFYKELGISSSASQDDIKKAYRKLARDNHPDKNPGDTKAEERFKAVSEAHAVLADPAKRKEYDEARRLFASGGFGRGGFSPGGSGAYGPGGFATGEFNLGDIFGGAAAAGGDGGLGDLLGGLFNRGGGGARTSSRPRRGSDVETETTQGVREGAPGGGGTRQFWGFWVLGRPLPGGPRLAASVRRAVRSGGSVSGLAAIRDHTP
ncbi:DnaJ domain-containing protein, partial [Nocardia wallacei]|uniref:DnaJ domain-containing protein n=1 Tax=Nocardia wallacei TaxID=480035 RepID=UPI00245495A6